MNPLRHIINALAITLTIGAMASCVNRGDGSTDSPTPAKAQEELNDIVNAANQSCPLMMDETVTMQSITTDNKYIVYEYVVNRDFYDLDSISDNPSAKQNILSKIKSETNESFTHLIDLAKIADFGIKYVYKLNDGSDSATITIDHSEL